MDKVKEMGQKAKQGLAGHDNDVPTKQPTSKAADPDAGLQSKDPTSKEAAPQGNQDVLKEPAG